MAYQNGVTIVDSTKTNKAEVTVKQELVVKEKDLRDLMLEVLLELREMKELLFSIAA